MKKITGLILIAALAVLLLPGLGVAKTYKFNYSWFAPTTEPHQPVVEYFISELDKRSNGQIKITYYPAGSLVGANQAWDAVEKGITDIDFPCISYTPRRFPLAYAWGLPMGIKDAYIGTKIFNEQYEKFQMESMSRVKILYLWSAPPTQLQTLKPLKTDGDLSAMFKGIKVRSNGVMADYMAALGATPVAMPGSDVYEALSKGVVDANVIASNALEVFRIGELVKYEYMWNLGATVFICIMNQKRWDQLPPDLQQIFTEVSAECLQLESEEWEKAQLPGREFGVKNGMQVVELTPEVEAFLVSRRQVLFDKYIADLEARGMGDQGREFLADLLERVEKYNN